MTLLRNDINGLRGISVLMVVFYHFNIGILKGGFVGVDVFFVISGFLMTKIIYSGLDRGNFNYFEFIKRRAFRIFPALFFLIFILLFCGAFFLSPIDLSSLSEQVFHALIFDSNNYYGAKTGYFSEGIDDRWLLHTWSLSVEWQFYLMYPVLLWLCLKVTKSKNAINNERNIFIALLICTAASLAYCLFGDVRNAFFSVLTRSWQMLAGGLVFMVGIRYATEKYASLLSYLGLLLIFSSVVMVKILSLESRWPGYYAILPVIGTCTILYSRFQGNLLLKNPFIQYLGTWSYSIYLWHWLLVTALIITESFDGFSKIVKLIGISLSIFLGYLSYRYVEGLNIFNKSNINGGISKLAIVAISLFCISYIFEKSDGLMLRVKNKDLYANIKLAELGTTYDSQCENNGNGNSKFCTINSNLNTKKILVIGDSHAGHLYSWFKENGKVNTTFYVKSGCPIIEGFERVGVDNNCREFTRKAFELAESGKYNTVIISQNWTGYSDHSDGLCTFKGSLCIPLSSDSNPYLSIETTKKSIDKILARKVIVAVVDSTPWFKMNVPKKAARDFFWFGTVKNKFYSKEFLDKNKSFDNLFKSYKNDENFQLLSFRPKLCKLEDCSVFDEYENIPIFKDNDHFNPYWIARNGQIFNGLKMQHVDK